VYSHSFTLSLAMGSVWQYVVSTPCECGVVRRGEYIGRKLLVPGIWSALWPVTSLTADLLLAALLRLPCDSGLLGPRLSRGLHAAFPCVSCPSCSVRYSARPLQRDGRVRAEQQGRSTALAVPPQRARLLVRSFEAVVCDCFSLIRLCPRESEQPMPCQSGRLPGKRCVGCSAPGLGVLGAAPVPAAAGSVLTLPGRARSAAAGAGPLCEPHRRRPARRLQRLLAVTHSPWHVRPWAGAREAWRVSWLGLPSACLALAGPGRSRFAGGGWGGEVGSPRRLVGVVEVSLRGRGQGRDTQLTGMGPAVPVLLGAVLREPVAREVLGTLNQVNARNWATAGVRHADFYTVLNLSLRFCNSFSLVIFLCPSQTVSSFALEQSSSWFPLPSGMVGDRAVAGKSEERLLLTCL